MINQSLLAEFTWEHALGLYNYWIVIFLMMTGFYMVIARGNLIKTIIGLNIFQTSVVLLYVTMGKVRGGTAPIMPPDADHGHGHEDHGHGDPGHGALSHPPSGRVGHEVAGEGELLQSKPLQDSTLSERAVFDGGSTLPEGEYSLLDHAPSERIGHEVAGEGSVQLVGFEETHADTAHQAAEIIYSNPLPSVLMLTAIVVGIATTALALALTVRVREEYGTIEEDEILEMERAA